MNRDLDPIDEKLHRMTFILANVVDGPILNISLQNLISTVYECLTLIKEIAVLRNAEKTAELERMP